MKILVLGGAGYIGSHVARQLAQRGHTPVIFDNLRKGHRQAAGDIEFIYGDLQDVQLLEDLFAQQKFDAVMHFAAHSLVGESVKHPDWYFRNNVANALNLLDAMRRHNVNNLVFSSTAAVYGEPREIPISEDHPKAPTNPYGESKLMVEMILQRYRKAYGLRSTSLRYFNAAGADPSGEIGEDHRPETHLIPLVLQVALGQREKIFVFGTDYDTPDGTCIRDYIHVNDLADAHILAVEALAEGAEGGVYNLGSGQGFSVQEVIDVAEKVVGRSIPREETDRRPGDPARLVASSQRIRDELGWEPKMTNLEDIIATAWRWHSTHPNGFGG